VKALSRLTFVVFVLVAFGSGSRGVAADFELKPGVPIYVGANEPEPVRRAVRDLQRDLRNVLGVESPVVNELPDSGIIVLGPQSGHDDLRNPAVKDLESHAVFARGSRVVLQGADMRGTIYAIYTFSEHFLGVPPAWFWSSWEPVHKSSVPIAAHAELIFASPHVHWRAWFPNDTDLLDPWRERSPENYEAFMETMLRLKLNTLEGVMMDSTSFDEPFRAGREWCLARDRGLVVTGHHMRTFGSRYKDWKTYWTKIRQQEPPPLTISNLPALEEFWRYHIETGVREKFEMVWLVGFRSDDDAPFWTMFPDSPADDAGRARIIQNMMARQVALLRTTTSNPAPLMRATLYNENADFFARKLLRPPDEPSLIWTFVNDRRDHFPGPDALGYHNDAKRPLGYYHHFQFTSTGAHLSQAEGLWKSEKNYRMLDAISGRPLELSVVNAGNIREFVLELSANARLTWDFAGYNSDAFMQEFCTQYFGPEHATRVAALYREYFDSFWQQKAPDLPGFDRQYLFQDNRFARALEQLLAQIPQGRDPNPLKDQYDENRGGYFRIVPGDIGAKNQLEAIQRGTTASIAKLERVTAEADVLLLALPTQYRTFFNDNLRVQARYMLELNRVLNAVAQAVNVLPNRFKALAALRQAEQSGGALRAALNDGEHGRFAGWYQPDTVLRLEKIRQTIAARIKELQGVHPRRSLRTSGNDVLPAFKLKTFDCPQPAALDVTHHCILRNPYLPLLRT